MTSKREVAIGSLVTCAILALIFGAVARPHATSLRAIQPEIPRAGNGRQQGLNANFAEVKRRFPKVDYDGPEPSDPVERAKRRKKGKHFDKGLVSAEPTTHSRSLFSEWDFNLSAFPVQQSNAVVIGKTVNGGAFISPDKSGVYTELSLKIEEVIYKQTDLLTNDRTIAVSRMGGLVHYKSGEESLLRIAGQNMPASGKRYLFFLRAIPDSDDDFEIVTGYELSASGVIALDDPAQFQEQNHRDIFGFIESVKSAVRERTPSK